MKTRLQCFFMGLALLAGVHPVLGQPALAIAPAGNQSVLYYSYSPTNFILQGATNLATPNWVTANDAMPVTAVTVSNTVPARFFRLIYTNPPAGMVLVPAGWFLMGDTLDGEADATPTNIFVSGFYMDVNLVSYGLWTNVYDYAAANGYIFDNVGAAKGTNYPVEMLDWYDCVKWCNARSQQAGLTPVYCTDAGFTLAYKTGQLAPYVNWAANGFRLPTEAEWEKAARGGLTGLRFPWGNRIDENQADYFGIPGSYSYDWGPGGTNAIGSVGGFPATSPVGSFDVNGYGLYDMAGNVFQRCWDWYAPPYGQPTPINPTGPGSGSNRVTRGGFFNGNPASLRCACRNFLGVPGGTSASIGFRCVSTQ